MADALASSAAPFRVTVHPYTSPTPYSCAYELGASTAQNALVFIGGLGDGPHTVPYIRTVAQKLETVTKLSYSVFELRMTSSFSAFGYSRLQDDVNDISAFVRYLRGIGKQKIVLMGHSTGCQDCMEYSNYDKHHNEPVDGFILQAPVSDREALLHTTEKSVFEKCLATAEEMIKNGLENNYLPRERLPPLFDTPITAYRWHSLAGVGGDDDFFSTDLPDETVAAIWGRVRKPILIVPSGDDEFVPKGHDMQHLLTKWKSHCQAGIASDLSGLIPGANHNVQQRESQVWLADRVAAFLDSLEN